MKKIVLFGATGNIGMYFADYCNEHLDKNEYELIAVGRKKTDWFAAHGIRYERVDLTRAEDFDRLPQKDVYAVVNMAGLLPAYLKEYDPFRYIDTNVTVQSRNFPRLPGGWSVWTLPRAMRGRRKMRSVSSEIP